MKKFLAMLVVAGLSLPVAALAEDNKPQDASAVEGATSSKKDATKPVKPAAGAKTHKTRAKKASDAHSTSDTYPTRNNAADSSDKKSTQE
ncbi:hypothetical protein IGB42_00047 [Andreprevotia sp. IGB-42]|uniref:hypothetical protein n=1 Tax=Andreprevotia sp. IGB-42 TaxID=2497473 RepID=UPI00135A02D8|nr:hypothetical protein [Andreprevotia sp. IGB-42]KAF0814971.1 hypothetical protein IGB42_00047 [Andreprevotia sp. IGB-42]